GEHILIKYSPDGDQLWVHRHPLPDHYVTAKALALDSNGNVIAGSWAGSIFLTLKYDPAGNLLWAAAEDWGTQDNIMNDMAVDSSDNVYVTGSSDVLYPGTSSANLYF